MSIGLGVVDPKGLDTTGGVKKSMSFSWLLGNRSFFNNCFIL